MRREEGWGIIGRTKGDEDAALGGVTIAGVNGGTPCGDDVTSGDVPLYTVNGRLGSVDTAVIVGTGGAVIRDEMVEREVLGTRGVSVGSGGRVLEMGEEGIGGNELWGANV